jgi:peptidoglycan/xylan/chitin deacetylase (PgdA/CDA1 family)
MYHYVRDLPKTRFPRLHAMRTDSFAKQVAELKERYDVVPLETALAFLSGGYRPARDLVVLTFDDGLKEHFTDVTPILVEHGLQGFFFIPTAGVGDQRVLSVHKSHFLMASLGFEEYRSAFLARLAKVAPSVSTDVDRANAESTYRWDTPDVAAFKYLLNFCLSTDVRSQVLDSLFETYLGDEAEFARDLYLTWDEGRQMQQAGMLLGGHSHNHVPLASLPDATRQSDLQTCMEFLRQNLNPQNLWPFSYPYGKTSSFNSATVQTLQELGICCSFGTEVGTNAAGEDLYRLRRLDPKDVAA